MQLGGTEALKEKHFSLNAKNGPILPMKKGVVLDSSFSPPHTECFLN